MFNTATSSFLAISIGTTIVCLALLVAFSQLKLTRCWREGAQVATCVSLVLAGFAFLCASFTTEFAEVAIAISAGGAVLVGSGLRFTRARLSF